MTRYIVLLCCLLLPVAGSARPEKGALRYHRLVNRAELAICGKNLKQSFALYRQAFAVNGAKPFSKDLLNAFYCAMDTRHYPEAEQYFRRLLSRGLTRQYLDRVREKYSGAAGARIASCISRYPDDTLKPSFMNDTVRYMIARDQQVRNYFLKLNPGGNYMNDSVRQVDLANALALRALFMKHGLPDEDRVGAAGHMVGADPLYAVIVVHDQQNSSALQRPPLFDTILYKGIFTYDVEPNFFVTVLNMGSGAYKDHRFRYRNVTLTLPLTISFGGYGFGELREEWPRYLPPAEEQRMNRERQKIGLPSLDEIRRKYAFQKEEQKKRTLYAKYNIRRGVNVFVDAQSEEERDAMKKEYLKHKPR